MDQLNTALAPFVIPPAWFQIEKEIKEEEEDDYPTASAFNEQNTSDKTGGFAAVSNFSKRTSARGADGRDSQPQGNSNEATSRLDTSSSTLTAGFRPAGVSTSVGDNRGENVPASTEERLV